MRRPRCVDHRIPSAEFVSGTATDIAAGYYHYCAIQAGTGEVVCWGDDSFGKATPPTPSTAVWEPRPTSLRETTTTAARSRRARATSSAGAGTPVARRPPPDSVNGISRTAIKVARGWSFTLAIVEGYVWTPTPTPTATPVPTPTSPPRPTGPIRPGGRPPPVHCLCEIQNINPNQVVLQNVGTGGKGSDRTRKVAMTLTAVDGPGGTCDPGERSNWTLVNLKMLDDDGDVLVDHYEWVVCEGGDVTTKVKRDVLFQGPMNCENGTAPSPKPGVSLGTITSTGSVVFGTADYVEGTRIKCFE